MRATERVCYSLVLSCVAALAPVGMAAQSASPETVVTLDGTHRGRVFEGIGALSAGASSRLLIDYPEPYRSQILDYLFKPHFGAGLQHLKVEIGADVNSTDGSEPSHMRSRQDRDYNRGYEWWLMTEAKKRNPDIILDALPWGAPGWIGGGQFYSADMAEYVADFVKGAKAAHGLDITFTGSWNEKVHDAAYVKELHHALTAAGLHTKVVCCDEYPGQGAGQWHIAEEMANDPELAASVDVIAAHYPQDDKGRLTTTEAARASGKPLWSSEDQPNPGWGPIVTRDWAHGGRILAQLYNRNYLEGALTKTEIWSPVNSYYDILPAPNSGLMYANTPWSGHYEVQSAIWATAHTTQFAAPGWQYLDLSVSKLPEKGDFVALRSPNNRDWSVVLQTIGAKRPQSVTFRLAGGLSPSTVHVWETNAQRTFEHVADLPVSDGAVTYRFEPDSLYSLTTTVGQAKGAAVPPPASPFPFP